ncbi:MAG: hypothetical protein ABIN89_22750, partial [Chitinophagaceae bacterium]
ICRNKWLCEIRKSKSVPMIDIDDYLEYAVLSHDLIVDSVEAEDPLLEKLPIEEEIKYSIACLGDPCKSLLLGFYYERFNMDQLAEKLGFKNAQVAKQRKFICIKRLRQSFTELLKLSKS